MSNPEGSPGSSNHMYWEDISRLLGYSAIYGSGREHAGYSVENTGTVPPEITAEVIPNFKTLFDGNLDIWRDEVLR